MQLDQLGEVDSEETDPAEQRKWDAKWADVNNWQRQHAIQHPDDLEPRRELFEFLRQSVRMTEIKNGTEWAKRHIHPLKAEVHMRGAAMILFAGELEASISREPPPPDDEWTEIRAEVEAKLTSLLEAEEVTEGDASLSRQSHASVALQCLREADGPVKALMRGLDGKERRGVAHHLGELARLWFAAGYRARSALGKEDEASALLWDKESRTVQARKDGAAQAGQLAADSARENRLPIMEAMHRRIAGGAKVSDAARHVHDVDKLGTSFEANRQMWYQHRKNFLETTECCKGA
ncbi:hypothetical protein LAZ40_13315 [Cereibacter sphaeroides]|uniref:hypothetical protein n=1 Tax=Cereibacter sphaeroides TaxID=1063 RepID=UPI001F1BEC51|nr:hypothetical protein [Cereibacter sphaeroides]MCE6960001.1 hypothetical protein [Cereibacter sphaeroides]MCE6973086.1 hypothetical protein [Cereibacter sphaeroides]